LRYACHIIRRPEDLPQKALFRAKPNGRRNQERPKTRWADGVNSDSLALGVSLSLETKLLGTISRIDLFMDALLEYINFQFKNGDGQVSGTIFIKKLFS
jgi:hypothetical protein